MSMGRGNGFSFVGGVCAGVLCVLCALNAMISIFSAMAYGEADIVMALAGVALLAIAAANLVGGSISLAHRVAGGIMMLSTAFLLFIFGALCMYVALGRQEIFSNMFDAEYAVGVRRAVLGSGLLLVLAEMLSGVAGVMSLLVPSMPEPPGVSLKCDGLEDTKTDENAETPRGGNADLG